MNCALIEVTYTSIFKPISCLVWKLGGDLNNKVNLCEAQRTSKLNKNSQQISVNDIVLVYN